MIKKAQIKTLMKAIESGMSITDSCILADIGRETFYRRCNRELEFKRLVDKAQAGWKKGLIEIIEKASTLARNWTAAAWLLERKFPDEFGIRQKIEHKGQIMSLTQIVQIINGNNGNDNDKQTGIQTRERFGKQVL